ncbi:MAG TPA: 4-hydroxy-3-methylbut-2-enyl diphosphate reductase [Candidatus Nanoarchaeia archaeon]|nr:4-hydroxy-3-methylbut-2-enyl diphosphate reductase [Candidatus Nanoarchaeia archaeon]
MVQKIILAKPRGFCAGVDRAVQIVDKALALYGPPLYVRHHIVHNIHVVKSFEKKGVIFVEDITQIPLGCKVILSAHGTDPKIFRQAQEKGLQIIDAVCPLVIKVHEQAIQFHTKGYSIILVGHAGHQEVIGTMGNAPMQLVEKVEDVKNLTIQSDKIAVLTQTTLSIDETKDILKKIKERYPKVHLPGQSDICYATTNRQRAVKEIAKKCDVVLVIGSETSSNSNRLVQTAETAGAKSYLVDDYSSVKDEWLKNCSVLGITSGASAPESLVQEIITQIQERYPAAKTEIFEKTKENYVFPLPAELTQQR